MNIMERTQLKLTTLLFCLCLSLSLFAQEKKLDPTPFIGEWIFDVPDAPYGYEKGTGKLFLEEDVLKGEFQIGGSTMKVNSFIGKPDSYSGTVYIDGYPVIVTLSLKDGKVTGKADDGNTVYQTNFTRTK